jgi:hypothetical protein
MIVRVPRGASDRGPGKGSGFDRIEVDIEALELEGLPAIDPRRLQSAFESELTRLLREHGLSARSGRAATSQAWIDAGQLTGAELDNPERLGEALARRIHVELAR